MQCLKKSDENNRKRQFFALLLILLAVHICIFVFVKEQRITETPLSVQEVQRESLIYEITKMDQKTEWEHPITVDLSVSEGVLIEEPGEYILSGKTEHAVVIDAEEQIVHLVLQGVDIHSRMGAAVEVKSAGKVIITLAEGTENVLRDSGNYSKEEESNAALYSSADLTINGTGSLFVYGYYKDAVHTKDVLKIIGGNVYVQAKRNGLRGNDGMVIRPAILTVESEGTGLQTTNSKQEDKGAIEICGGNISITAGKYGMAAVSDVHVRDCVISCLSVMTPIRAEGQEYVQEGCFSYE